MSAAAPSPDDGLGRLARFVVADAVQRIERSGPLDDAAALRQAFDAEPTRPAQFLQRARLLGERLGLLDELAHARQGLRGVALLLAVAVALSALGLARSVVGEGRSINAMAALVSLLGLHLLTLIAWLLSLLGARPGAAGWSLGGLALWLTARLPGTRAHGATLAAAATQRLARHGLLPWALGAVGHTIWTLSFVLVLGALGFAFAFHAYRLSWESTILGADFFQWVVRSSGWLPGLLGLPVPDAAAVQQVGQGLGGAAGTAAAAADAASQRAWAWWLMGAVLVYGLLPRAVLALLSVWCWRRGVAALAVDGSDPYVRAIYARLDALEPPPRVLDPEQPAPAAPGQPVAAAPPGAPGSLAIVGFELPPEATWPPAGLPAGTQAPTRIAGSAAERQAVLTQLAQARPAALLLLVHASSSPDRGTARFVREAQALAGRSALLLSTPAGAAPPAAAVRRWQAWCDAEGFSALAVVDSSSSAMDWIASTATQEAAHD